MAGGVFWPNIGECAIIKKISPKKRVFAIPGAKIVPGMNPIAKKGLGAAELKYDLTFRVGRGKK